MFLYNTAVDKARSLKEGDMVSWSASGGTATGKVIHVMDYGTLDVPNSKFKLKGDKKNPAVLIQLYRDGKPTDTKVGHKMSSLSKSLDVLKHGSHDQKTHGRGGGGLGGGMESGGRPIDSKRDNKEISDAMDDVADIRTELNGMTDPDDGDNYIDDLSDDDQTIIDSALDDLEEAEEQLTGAFDAKTTSAHLNKIENAQTRLGDSFDALRNANNSNLKSLMDKVESVEEKLENYADLFLEGESKP